MSDLTPENLTYTYTFDDQIEVANAHNGGRPLRDYDIVVEAFTEGGDGSAQFGSDGVAQNPLGYDILNIENPQLRKIPLTDPAEGEQCIGNDDTSVKSYNFLCRHTKLCTSIQPNI